MTGRTIRARDWAAPALSILVLAAVVGQAIRTPELVASARSIDVEAWGVISGIAPRTGSRPDGRVLP